MHEQEWAERFGPELEAGAPPAPEAPPEYRAARELAATLAVLDLSDESRVRGPLRETLLTRAARPRRRGAAPALSAGLLLAGAALMVALLLFGLLGAAPGGMATPTQGTLRGGIALTSSPPGATTRLAPVEATAGGAIAPGTRTPTSLPGRPPAVRAAPLLVGTPYLGR
jgi:hypothetical protein